MNQESLFGHLRHAQVVLLMASPLVFLVIVQVLCNQGMT